MCSLKGAKRVVNPVGQEFGPYVVDRPVGADWVTSMFFVLRCKLGCGHELKRLPGQMKDRKTKVCFGCKGTGVRKEVV
jgi:hypothetical protein